jgi:hypothetical protein
MYLSRKIACLNQIDFFLPLSFRLCYYLLNLLNVTMSKQFFALLLFFLVFLIAFHYHVKKMSWLWRLVGARVGSFRDLIENFV